MEQILSILWEIVLISLEILWYLENLYDVSKNFGKMLHWPKFLWRRGGGDVAKMNMLRKKIFGTGRAQSEKVGQIYFRPPNFLLPVRPCIWIILVDNERHGRHFNTQRCKKASSSPSCQIFRIVFHGNCMAFNSRLTLRGKYLNHDSKQNSHFIFEMLGNVSFQTTNLTMGYQNQGVGFSKICI